MDKLTDCVYLAQELIKCKSITPVDDGAIALLKNWLEQLGFKCHRLKFTEKGTSDVENLFAIYDIPNTKHFCFAGHTDVVPTGNTTSWKYDPFSGIIENDILYGRGAADMKGGIAAFIAALASQIKEGKLLQTTSLLITGDEEEEGINGTKKVLEWLKQKNIKPDFCLVGEPVCQDYLGDTIKIGRRGSINTKLKIQGTQGHVAYPEQANNPIPVLLSIMQELNKCPNEESSDYFDSSNLEITSIDVNNPVTNVIPENITARFNIRFSDKQTCNSLSKWIETVCKKHTIKYKLVFNHSGEAEYIPSDEIIRKIADIIENSTKIKPKLNTKGGTSDARFIRNYCPVIEFGLPGKSMHQVNECVAVKDLKNLANIYKKIINLKM